ncbi:hypothetical protein J4G02_22690 [Candidatus Poribacteria bacterium]|nr:hypothetical protein [Candidatus Poribacteria bacterium]
MIRIVCINLKRRIDRRAAWLGAAFAQRVPDDIIEFYYGYDAADYSRQEARERFSNDFPDVDFPEARGTGSQCVTWSYLSCLKRISEYPEDMRVILMQDHTVFGCEFGHVERVINSADDFNVIQFFYGNFEEAYETFYKVNGKSKGDVYESYNNDLYSDYLGDSASCNVYTPKGARLTLARYQYQHIHNLDTVFMKRMSEQPDVYRVKDQWFFIRRPLCLSKWMDCVDSDREYYNYLDKESAEPSHSNPTAKWIVDLPESHAGLKANNTWGQRAKKINGKVVIDESSLDR